MRASVILLSTIVEKIFIRGVTKEGNKFRPSDWAERLYYALASYDHNRRMVFNPMVHLKQGEKFKCFVINPILEQLEPLTFGFLIDFATSNNLEVTDQDFNPINF